MREIGYETYELWKVMLEERLTLIMPRYQQLYQTTLFTLDIENPYHMITTHTEKDNINVDGSRETSDTASGNSTTKETSQGTDDLSNSVTENTTNNNTVTGSNNTKIVDSGTSNSTKNADSIHSDFPQVAITQDYASTEDKATESIDNTTNSTSTTTGSTSQETKGEGSFTSSNTGSNTHDNTVDSTTDTSNTSSFNATDKEVRDRIMDYLHDVKGRADNMQILDSIAKWRDLIININEMIIDELTDLFMLIY